MNERSILERLRGNVWGRRVTSNRSRNCGFIDKVIITLKRPVRPPSVLRLEVTERVWIENDKSTVATLWNTTQKTSTSL